MPGIVTKDILEVFVACALQSTVDETFVDESSAPKDLQNSRLNIFLTSCKPRPPEHAMRGAGYQFIWLLSSAPASTWKENMADSEQVNAVSIFIAIFNM